MDDKKTSVDDERFLDSKNKLNEPNGGIIVNSKNENHEHHRKIKMAVCGQKV